MLKKTIDKNIYLDFCQIAKSEKKPENWLASEEQADACVSQQPAKCG